MLRSLQPFGKGDKCLHIGSVRASCEALHTACRLQKREQELPLEGRARGIIVSSPHLYASQRDGSRAGLRRDIAFDQMSGLILSSCGSQNHAKGLHIPVMGFSLRIKLDHAPKQRLDHLGDIGVEAYNVSPLFRA